MNLLHLHYFKLVAQTENIAKAAQQAYISASGLSKVISRLESEVGYPLFERLNNKLELNDAGKYFYTFAESVLNMQNDCLERIKIHNDRSTEIVRIAVPADRLISGVIDKFLDNDPSVRFSQYIMDARTSQEALENREIDFAISHRPIHSPGIIWNELMTHRLVLAVGHDHPFAKEGIDSIDLLDLKDERLFVHEASTDERDIICEYCLDAGFSPNIIQLGPEQTFEKMKEGKGIAVVQDYFFKPEESQIQTGWFIDGNLLAHRIDIRHPECTLMTGITRIENRTLNLSAKALYDKICEWFHFPSDL